MRKGFTLVELLVVIGIIAVTGGAAAGKGEGGPGGAFKEATLRDSHARATALAARHANDPALAGRAWAELLGPRFTPAVPPYRAVRMTGPDLPNPVDEVVAISTNGAAQWSLAAMECSAWIGDALG